MAASSAGCVPPSPPPFAFGNFVLFGFGLGPGPVEPCADGAGGLFPSSSRLFCIKSISLEYAKATVAHLCGHKGAKARALPVCGTPPLCSSTSGWGGLPATSTETPSPTSPDPEPPVLGLPREELHIPGLLPDPL